MSRTTGSVLFVQLGGIGDLLLSVPALKALRRDYPNVTGLFSSASPARLAMECGLVSEAFLLPGKGLLNRLGVLAQLRKRGRWDALVAAQGHNRRKGVLLARLLGAKRSAGENGAYTHPVFVEYGGHAAHRTAAIVRALGSSVDEDDFLITLPPEAEAIAAEQLAPLKKEKRRLVGVHAGSHPRLAYKRWPEERFVKTLLLTQEERAKEGEGIVPVLVGGPDEHGLSERILTDCQKSGLKEGMNLCGKLSITETAAVLSQCDALLSNDSGIMHLSAAVGTPVCAIYAMTDPEWIGPLGKNHSIIRTEALDCSPCYDRGQIACSERLCLFAVTPERVVPSLIRLLQQRGENR